MDVICFGHQNWDYCWTAKQQLLSRMARRGHRILYVDPDWNEGRFPVRRLPAALGPGRSGAGLRRIGEADLHVYTYRYVPPLRWRWNARRHPVAVAAIAERLGFRDPVGLALHPRARTLIARLRLGALAYFVVDEVTAFGERTLALQQLIRSREEALARRADVVLGVSQRLVDRLRALNANTHLLENAADLDHFSPENLRAAEPHPDVARLPAPRAVFVGQIDERLDQRLLLDAAARRPDVSWVLAGRVKPGVDVGPLESQPNIHLLGYQPYERLPGILRESDVTIAPYARSELTRSCNPLKVYEYLATGRPVVATDVDGLDWCRESVAITRSVEDFTRAVDAALAHPDDGREARLALAARNGWDRRTEELERHLDGALARRREREQTGPRQTEAARRPYRASLGPRGRVAFAAVTLAGAAWFAARLCGRLLTGRRPLFARRILFARRSRLGDLVAVVPALRALRWRFPTSHIALGVQPGCLAADLLRSGDLVDEVVEIPPAEGGTVEELRRALGLFLRGTDVLFTGADFSIILESFFCGAPRRYTLDDGHPVRDLATHTVPLDPFLHEAENNLRLVESLTGPIPAERRATLLPPLPAEAESRAEMLLHELDPASGGDPTLVAVHFGAQRPSRTWPAELFARFLTSALRARQDVLVLLTGTSSERDRAQRLRAQVAGDVRERVHDVSGRTGVAGLAALLRRTDAVVSNDTGVMHLARACGAPLVALLGPENDLRWGPYPIGTAPVEALRVIVPCAPCKRWDCAPLYCLRSLDPEAVVAALFRVLDARPEHSPSAAVSVSDVVSPEDARRLFVQRRMAFRDWAALEAAGFDVPAVGVAGAGALDPEGFTGTPYPRGRLRAAAADGSPADGDVQSTDLVALMPAGSRWRGAGLDSAVAELVRDPGNPGVLIDGVDAGHAVLVAPRPPRACGDPGAGPEPRDG